MASTLRGQSTRASLAQLLHSRIDFIEELAALGRKDRHALSAKLATLTSAKLGARKNLELSLRSLPPPFIKLVLDAAPPPLALRLAWLYAAPVIGSCQTMMMLTEADDVLHSSAHAAALIAGGALLRRLSFTLRADHGRVVGCADLLIVRAPPPGSVSISPCRICWGDEDGDWLDPALAEAFAVAAVTGQNAAMGDLPAGSLLHDVCGCRGDSVGSVHEGCLVQFLAATTDRTVGNVRSGVLPSSLQELKCNTCNQPFVGRASHLLSRCAAAVRAARALNDEQISEAAGAAADAGELGARELEEEAAIAAVEGRINEATALWRAGEAAASMEKFIIIVQTLQEMREPRDPMRLLRKHLLQHSAEHNVGLIFKE